MDKTRLTARNNKLTAIFNNQTGQLSVDVKKRRNCEHPETFQNSDSRPRLHACLIMILTILVRMTSSLGCVF